MMNLILGILSTAVLVHAQTAPQVQLGGTTVIGKPSDFGPTVETFQGLPYAEPPVGSLRLTPPVSQTTLNGSTFNATAFGPACLQPGLDLTASSEDCLSLNIFRPAGTAANSSLPVMFWIHGGAFTTGSGNVILYDGTFLVNTSVTRGTPVVYVSINYRLGPLGFPAGAEAATRNDLNLGLKDQLAALQWVNTNIGAFGGDASKVLVFGESAGARSVDYHMFGPTLKDFARAAILESSYRDPLFGPEKAEPNWQSFVQAVPECTSTAGTNLTFPCLQRDDVNSSALIQAVTAAGANGSSPFQPVIDGQGGLIPDFLSKLTPQSPLPMISGSNLDEGTLFTPQNTSSENDIELFIIGGSTPSPRGAAALSAAAEKFLQLYPDDPALGSPFGTGNNTFGLSPEYKRLAAVVGDFIFQSARRSLSQNRSESGIDVFSYHFTDPNANLPQVLSGPVAPGSIGITHSFEIPFVFGFAPFLGITSPTAIQLSAIMQEYWLSFATSLNPNDGKGLNRPNWNQYTSSSETLIQLDGANLTTVPDTYHEEQIAFINKDPLLFRR